MKFRKGMIFISQFNIISVKYKCLLINEEKLTISKMSGNKVISY